MHIDRHSLAGMIQLHVKPDPLETVELLRGKDKLRLEAFRRQQPDDSPGVGRQDENIQVEEFPKR